MMDDMHRILLVEDSRDDAELFGFALDDAGLEYVLRVVGNERDLREALDSFLPSIVVSDLGLPGYSGLAALELAHAVHPQVPLLLLTGFDDLDPPSVPARLLRKAELSRVPVLIAGLAAA